MTSDSELLQQADTQQQQSLTKKKSNLSWIGFFIDLTIFHLLFGWALATFGKYFTFEFALGMTPFLLVLAVIDYITAISYSKKQRPPWKVIFIPLLLINAIFFVLITLGPIYATRYLGSNIGLGYLGILLFTFGFLAIDLIQLLVYVFTHHS